MSLLFITAYALSRDGGEGSYWAGPKKKTRIFWRMESLQVRPEHVNYSGH